MLTDQTFWIVACAASVAVLIVALIVLHVSQANDRQEIVVSDISSYRRNDLITDGHNVYKVRAIHAPSTLVVTLEN